MEALTVPRSGSTILGFAIRSSGFNNLMSVFGVTSTPMNDSRAMFLLLCFFWFFSGVGIVGSAGVGVWLGLVITMAS